MSPRLPLPRLLAANFLAAVLYGLTVVASLFLTMIEPHVSAFWLPAGLALALLTWRGPALLPGVWLGYTLTSVLVDGAFWPVAALIALGSTGSAWLGAALFRRWLPAGLVASPEAPRRFVFLAYACAAPAALWGPLVMQLFGTLPPGSLDNTIIVWWLGDALGILVLAPPLLAGREALASPRILVGGGPLAVLAILATTTLVLVTFVADFWFLPNAYLQAALLLPPMMWLTARCHPAISLTINLVAAIGFVHGAAGRLGPLLGATPLDRIYTVHGFVFISSATLLFLAAHIHRVREIAQAAQVGKERFERLTRLTSDWYWEQDAQLRFTRSDGPALGLRAAREEFFKGKTRWELPGIEPYSGSWDGHRADLEARRTFVGFVLRYRPSADQTIYYSISGEPIFAADGAFAGYRGVGRVVTTEIESREALLASERQFHDLADATFEGIFVHDFGRVVFANQALANLLGHAIDAIVGHSVLDFAAPEHHAEIVRHLALDDVVKSIEAIAIAADGRRIPVEIFGRPFVFRGRPLRIAAVRDISSHRAAEGALAAQLAFQHKLFDTIPNAVFYKDRQGRYLGYNRAFAETFGIDAGEYVGKTVLDLVPSEYGQQLKANDDALYANPGIQAYEEPMLTVRGQRDVMLYKDVFLDENSQVAGLLGVIVDITERKKIEDRLRRFQELSPAAIGILDTNGRMIYLNPAATELFGFSLAEVSTIDAWWQVAYPDPAYREERRAAWFAAIEQALREGRQMLRFDNRVHCKDGRELWVETLASIGEQEIFMIFTDLSNYLAEAPSSPE